ncbi:hypothetical protein K3495_g7480 [Podosphaera aphanis]|nr:hypothetical protein K3495_g7480 [Podosphaera aphanis]
MHSATECKTPLRCRNCGGPHRSDSRNCLVRPTRTGPVTKEQLATIRQYRQREYVAVDRAKAAVQKAEEAAIIATSVDVQMEEGTGFGVLNSEEEI